MRYRLIASDLDETLLDANSKISNRNKEAIQAVIKKGVKFIIATGRMFKTSINYLEDLGISCDCPIINNHGASINSSKSGDMLFHQPLNNIIARSVIEEVAPYGSHVSIYIKDKLFVREKNQFTDYYDSIADLQVDIVGDLNHFLLQNGQNPCKITVVDEDIRLDEIENMLNKYFDSELSIRQSSKNFLEITDKAATKGQALDWVAKKYGFKPSEILAIGDGPNDYDMISYAGMGVAVSNAHPSVLNVADYVTSSNVEDGVAEAIEKHILLY